MRVYNVMLQVRFSTEFVWRQVSFVKKYYEKDVKFSNKNPIFKHITNT